MISQWPDGVYYGEAMIDDDGHRFKDIHIRAKVTKRGSDLEVDLTDCHEEVDGFINSAYPNTRSAVVVALSYLIDPETPKNDGAFRPIYGDHARGHDRASAAGQAGHAFDQLLRPGDHRGNHQGARPRLPGRAPWRDGAAGSASRSRASIRARANPSSGICSRPGPGGGASPAGDGWPGAGEWQAAGGIKFGSLEVAEVRFPLFFRRHQFRPDSGGDGRFRGGPGGDLEFAVEVAEPAVGNTAGDGVKYGACGILGGQDGAPHRYVLRSSGREERVLKTKEVGIVIRPGDVIAAKSGGGGGWGDPAERSAEERARDVALGFVTGGRALIMSYRIGIDVGGTFTDVVAVDEAGRVTHAKSASTPADQSVGVMEGLTLLAEALGITLAAMLEQDRAHRPWDDGCDQRSARTQGCARRPAHHRRPYRYPGDARGPEGRPLQPARRRRRSRWCRATGASACRSGFAPMVASRRR